MDTTINVDIIDLADKKLRSEYRKSLITIKRLEREVQKLQNQLETKESQRLMEVHKGKKAIEELAKLKDSIERGWNNTVNKLCATRNIAKILANVRKYTDQIVYEVDELYKDQEALAVIEKTVKAKKKK
jgi:hypothetical protein